MALFTSSPLKKHKSVLFLLENESAFWREKRVVLSDGKKSVCLLFKMATSPTRGEPLTRLFFDFWSWNMHRGSSVQNFIFWRQSWTIMFEKNTGKCWENIGMGPPLPPSGNVEWERPSHRPSHCHSTLPLGVGGGEAYFLLLSHHYRPWLTGIKQKNSRQIFGWIRGGKVIFCITYTG